MKKLGKKNVESVKTVEAFSHISRCTAHRGACGCPCISADSSIISAKWREAYYDWA